MAGWSAPAAAAQTASEVEAPEFGRPGPLTIGTRTAELRLPDRPRIATAGVVRADRVVGVRFWYPATAPAAAARVTYRHALQLPGQPAWTWTDEGRAIEDAPLREGAKAPFVLISHGFGGWSTHMSRLAEALASRGYVVASIDHRDMRFDSVPAFLLSFGNVLADRAEDQRQVLTQLLRTPAPAGHPMRLVDAGKVALIGYSMGGYGALATAGAVPDAASKPLAQLPAEARAVATKSDPATARLVKALVLIAPWGGQPTDRVWQPESLARVTTPTLLIGGDRDPIVDFAGGIRWLFDGLRGADRRLLVFREAQHNVAGNAVALDIGASADVIGFLRDPVWRGDRINQINQHFITAFLDRTLRDDLAKAPYLDVPSPIAADGTWPVAFGEQTRGRFAGPEQPGYWRGFQRGSATGLELHARRAG
jgi:predicted dienelactone hydrolase